MAAKPRIQAGPCCQRWNRFVAPVTSTCRFASSLISAGSIRVRAATGAPSFFIVASRVPVTRGSLVAPLQKGNSLDVRGVREHVDRLHAQQLVAVLLAQRLYVSGERRRVARDVDEAGRADPAEPAQRLAGEAGAGRVDDDDVGRPRAVEQ